MLGERLPCGGGPPIPLQKARLLVGRKPSCDIMLPFATVSSRHCELEFRDGIWWASDLDSSNGIRVNGERCMGSALMPNDILWVARYRFQIVYQLAVGQAKRPPARMPPGPAATAAPANKRAARPVPGEAASSDWFGELAPCGGGDAIPLRQTRVVIGRHKDCDIVLRFPTVSGRHCELEWIDGDWFVRDLGSSNGTRVDGRAFQLERLRPGCILGIADQRFTVIYPGQGPRATATLFSQSLLEKAGLIRLHPPKPENEEPPPSQRHSLDDPD